MVQFIYWGLSATQSTKKTSAPSASRALGIKPYSTKTESAFLENLNHALDNVFVADSRCVVRREVSIAHVFRDNPGAIDLFYTGRFDFVVYQREGRQLTPVLAIELDGREHRDDPVVQREMLRKRESAKNMVSSRSAATTPMLADTITSRKFSFDILTESDKGIR